MSTKKLFLWGVCYLLIVFFILEICVQLFSVPEYIFPSPSKVFVYIFKHSNLFISNTFITIVETLIGISIAFIVGIFLGAIFLYFQWLEILFSPLIFILQIIPLVALSPLIIIWFGFGIGSKIWIVFIFGLYPILSFFKSGLKSIEPEMLTIAHLLNSSKKDIFLHLLLPFCLLHALLGLKIALTYSLTSAIIAEFLGSSIGLGVLLTRSLSSFNSLSLFGTIYIIIMVSGFLYMLGYYFEKIVQKKLGYSGV